MIKKQNKYKFVVTFLLFNSLSIYRVYLYTLICQHSLIMLSCCCLQKNKGNTLMEITEKKLEEEQKYLMFYLNKEHYGIPILKVNEIIGLMDITPIPKTPIFLKGIINLRGKIIPVIDLRLKFSMEERTYDEQTCIIIVEVILSNIKSVVGVVVDKVAEVVKIYKSDIEQPPQYGQEEENGFLTGVGKVKALVVMLLDIEKIVNCNELTKLIQSNDKKTKKTKESNYGMV